MMKACNWMTGSFLISQSKRGHRSSGKTHQDRHHQLAIGWTNHLGTIILLAILHLTIPIPVIMKVQNGNVLCSLRQCSVPVSYEFLPDVTFWMTSNETSGVGGVGLGNFFEIHPFKKFLGRHFKKRFVSLDCSNFFYCFNEVAPL